MSLQVVTLVLLGWAALAQTVALVVAVVLWLRR
jgi:hypothetical protein